MGKKLRIRMLGTFALEYDGKPIYLEKTNATKLNHLIQILLYHGEEGVQRKHLCLSLFGTDEVADPSNSLRGLVFRLRKILRQYGMEECIVIEDGVYRVKIEEGYECDCHLFEENIRKALNAEQREERINYLKEAFLLYTGDFLPMLGSTNWAVTERVRYKQIYTNCVEALCTECSQRQNYTRMYEVAEKAASLYPYDGWQEYMVEALTALNRLKEAISVYKETEKLLFDELGITPSKTMLEKIRKIAGPISNENEYISEIQRSLSEEQEAEGAYYCSYPTFVEIYRYLERVMERTGQEACLMTCIITDGKGHPQQSQVRLNNVGEDIEQAIQRSLRKGDMFTRYSAGQYLIFLLGMSEIHADLVTNRINGNLQKKSRKAYIKYHIVSTKEWEKLLKK